MFETEDRIRKYLESQVNLATKMNWHFHSSFDQTKIHITLTYQHDIFQGTIDGSHKHTICVFLSTKTNY